MNRLFHLFSNGDNVLFRTDVDYIHFNNKFAASSYACQLQPLAETTMSTHFHSVVEVTDDAAVDEFAFKLRKAYAMYYCAKYGQPLGNSFMISKVEIAGREAALNELLYVMKNPAHHYVTAEVLTYPYSSASCLFLEKMMPSLLFEGLVSRSVSAGNLSKRRMAQLLGRDTIPKDWRIYSNGLILPSSYINGKRARAFWNNNVKAFLYDINRNLTDARKEVIKADVLDLRSSGITDIEVCRIIDEHVSELGKRSFHYLDSDEKGKLARRLADKAATGEQIRRCLWL